MLAMVMMMMMMMMIAIVILQFLYIYYIIVLYNNDDDDDNNNSNNNSTPTITGVCASKREYIEIKQEVPKEFYKSVSTRWFKYDRDKL